VLRYKTSIDAERRKVLDELVAEAKELNIAGYAKPSTDVRNSEEGN
jgi:F0F1-type ATP synthase membrane subunit b/b'